MDAREQQRRTDAGAQAGPGRSGDGRHRRRCERGGEQLAFEADIDNAGALGIEAGEAGQDQRYREADGRVENEGDIDEVHHLPPVGAANRRASGARSMSPMAPVNRITRAWSVTIISRVMPGIWNASSLPP